MKIINIFAVLLASVVLSQAATIGSSVEAETMTLDGFLIESQDAASGGQVIVLSGTSGSATLSVTESGMCDIETSYFDESDGVAVYKLYADNVLLDAWEASREVTHAVPAADNRFVHYTKNVTLTDGQTLELLAYSNSGEPCRVDSIALSAPSTAEPLYTLTWNTNATISSLLLGGGEQLSAQTGQAMQRTFDGLAIDKVAMTDASQQSGVTGVSSGNQTLFFRVDEFDHHLLFRLIGVEGIDRYDETQSLLLTIPVNTSGINVLSLDDWAAVSVSDSQIEISWTQLADRNRFPGGVFALYAEGTSAEEAEAIEEIVLLHVDNNALDTLVDYQHTAGSAVPDSTLDGVTSSVSLDGTGLFGAIATSIDQYSVAAANGLGLDEDQSLDHYFAYNIASSKEITFCSLAITPYAKVTTRDYRLSYIINGETETFINEWSDAPDSDATRVIFDFADFATAEDVEFRVYWGGTAPSSADARAYVDDFILFGSTNAIPFADYLVATVDEDSSVAITLSGSDADGDSLSYTVVNGPANGSLSGTAPALTYTPSANYNGTDSFTYTVNDGTVDSAVATVSITIDAVNDAPVADAKSETVDEDDAVVVSLTGSDIDGDSLTYSVVSQPANGTLSGTAPDLTYTPGTDYVGFDSFTFTVNDGSLTSAVATVSITVRKTIDITLAGEGDGYDEANTAAWRSTNVDKLFDYDNDNVYGTEGLFFAGDATDGNGGGGQGFAQHTQVDAAWATFSAGADLASVAEGGSFSYALIDDPTLATGADVADWTTIRSAGFVANTPAGAGSWCELVTFDIDETTPSRFRIGLMAGNLSHENWNPSALRLSVDGGTPVQVTNLPGTPIAQAGWVFFDVDLNGRTSGTFSIECQRRADEKGTSLGGITFDLHNDLPVASNATVTVAEDTSVDITLTGSDPDGSNLTYTVETQPANGTLSGTAPDLTYTPSANYNGADSFTYTVNDGTLDSAVATVSITVTAVNDAPVAAAKSAAVAEDDSVAITLSGSDVDGDSLTYAVVMAPANGTLSGTAPNLTYTPNANYNGADSFTYVANDGTVDSAAATVSITVNAVNDAPVADAKSAAVDEDDSVAITLSGTDVDGDSLTYAVVTAPANGTLSGTAPSLTYTPDANYNGADSFTYTVNDGTEDSEPVTVLILVGALVDYQHTAGSAVPDSTLDGVTSSVSLDGTGLFGDIATSIDQYSVAAANGLGVNEDQSLDHYFAYNIVSSKEITFCSLAITPYAKVTTRDYRLSYIINGETETFINEWSDAPDSVDATRVTFDFADFTTAEDVEFRVYWGGTASSSGDARAYVDDFILFGSTNAIPVADDLVKTVDEDSSVVITLSGSDADGDSLTFAVVTAAANGTLSGTAPNLTYTPDADFNGADSFTYVANDGTVDSAEATVSITVDAVNDTPVADAKLAAVDEDDSVAITLSGSDLDGDSLTYAVVTAPANGTLSGTAPNLTYTPDANFNGADSFTYVANDGTVDSAAATVSITVNAVNDAPVANAKSAAVDEDDSVAITLSGSDVDGDSLTFAVVTAAANGTLSGTAPNLTYTPNADYNGADSFTYVANDGTVDSAVATVSITVDPVNDAPLADAKLESVSEDSSVGVTLSGSDSDGDSLSYAVMTAPVNGVLSGTAPALTYTPNANFNGSDSFTYTVNDGTVDSAEATVSITVDAVNDTPVADAKLAAVDEDDSVAITLSGSDVDGDSLTYAVVMAPANGTLSGTAPNLTYTPNADYNGADSFTYVANDGTVDSAEATVSITVIATHFAAFPMEEDFESYANGALLTGSNGWYGSGSVVATNYSGEYAGAYPMPASGHTQIGEGGDEAVLLIESGADLPEVWFDSVVQFDDVGNLSDAAIPENAQAWFGLDESLHLNVYHGADDGLSTSNVWTALTQTSIAAQQWVRLTVKTSYANGAQTRSFFRVYVDGGNALTSPDAYLERDDASPATGGTWFLCANQDTIGSRISQLQLARVQCDDLVLTTNAVFNNAPVASSMNTHVVEDSAVLITLSGSDVDGDSLTYAVVTAPTNGTLSGTAPDLTYTPDADFNGADSFTYVANDGTTNSAVATVSITVDPVNDAPLADAIVDTLNEDDSVAVILTGSDVDGDSLTYAVVMAPANGTLSGTAPALTYTPNADYNGADSFTYVANDGTVDSAAATVSITVNAINDAPVAAAKSAAVDEDDSVAITLSGTDVDGDSLTYTVVTAPANGTLSGTAPSLTYTPDANYNGADSFTFTVNDGTVDSAAVTVSITVNAVNDAPVFSADTIEGVAGMQNSAYSGSLSATDADGDSLSYSAVSGPSWLTVASDGSLSGTPLSADIGTNSWTVSVSDGNGGTDQATLNISVGVDPNPAVRVTEYYLTTGDFSGTTATVTLDQDLADDYYILVRGSRVGDGLSYPDNNYARVTAVPDGLGELASSGASDEIELGRYVADMDWEGVVTVVECVNSASAAGFKLVDIVETSLTGTSGTDTSAAWNDAAQVVLFGGYRGGGASYSADVASRNQSTSVHVRLYPSGSSTLNWSRNAGGETLVDAVMTTFVVEWGSEWGVQHVNIAGSNGGGGADATGEYTTASISSVNRANTWVWGTGTRADAGIGDNTEACLVTMGDGVNQNTTESTVAVGSEYTDAYDFDVYAMTHADLAVDYRFKADGDSTGLDVAVTVDSATDGARFGWVYNGVNGTGDYHPRDQFWARYTSDSEITISRGFDGQNFPAWVQGIDFSGLNE